MKKIPALIAAFFTTAVVALGMLLIGANALFTPVQSANAASGSSVDASAPAASATADNTVSQAAPDSASSAAQIQQLQDRLAQYQQREQQYQQREQQYQDQINTLEQQVQEAGSQIQTVQSLLQELQRRGLIVVDNSGQIFIRGGRDGD